MKRSLSAVALLTFLAAAAPVFAVKPVDGDAPAARYARTTVIDDVIRMSNAGVDEDAILKFVRKSHDLYVVDADVIIALTDAKVSKAVLEAVMDEAYDPGNDRGTRSDDRGRTRTIYVRSPYYGYAYDPWYYSPFAYDPFFFGSRVSFGFGFGGFHGSRGGRGGHGGHGGHGGRGGRH
jgi:hypothetical protein